MKKLRFETKISYRYITLMRFRDFFFFFILLFIISFPLPVEVRNVWLTIFFFKKNDKPNVASLLPYICLQFDLTNLWLKWRELGWFSFFLLMIYCQGYQFAKRMGSVLQVRFLEKLGLGICFVQYINLLVGLNSNRYILIFCPPNSFSIYTCVRELVA